MIPEYTTEPIGANGHQSDADADLHQSGADSDCLEPRQLGMEIQSGRVRFQSPLSPGSMKGGAVRGRVSQMSNASRRRLMAAFASLDYEALAESKTALWFITLTTPERYWDDTRGVYKALRRFRDALQYQQRSLGFLGGFVRREIGSKRGMLHYHLVLVGGVFCAPLVSNLWTKALRSETPVRVDVQALETPERVAKYLSKYVAKVGYEGKERAPEAGSAASFEPAGPAPEAAPLSEAHNVGNGYTGGRWWYIWGKETLPWGEKVVVLGEQAKAIAKHFRRIFRKWLVEKAVKREIADLNKSMGLSCKHWNSFMIKKSRRWIEKRLPYASFLRRSSSGFTFLMSPELVQKMMDAACIAVIGSPARFPWEEVC